MKQCRSGLNVSKKSMLHYKKPSPVTTANVRRYSRWTIPLTIVLKGPGRKNPTENLSITQGIPTGRYSSFYTYTAGSCSKANIYSNFLRG